MLKYSVEKTDEIKFINFKQGFKIYTVIIFEIFFEIKEKTVFIIPPTNDTATGGKTKIFAITAPNEIFPKNFALKYAVPISDERDSETEAVIYEYIFFINTDLMRESLTKESLCSIMKENTSIDKVEPKEKRKLIFSITYGLWIIRTNAAIKRDVILSAGRPNIIDINDIEIIITERITDGVNIAAAENIKRIGIVIINIIFFGTLRKNKSKEINKKR